MEDKKSPPIYIIIYSLLTALIPPILLAFILNASGPLYLVVLYILAVNGAFYLFYKYPNIIKVKILLGFLLVTGLLFIIAGLNLTPSAAYLVWMKLFANNLGKGSISYMFVLKSAFLSAGISGFIYSKNKIIPVLILLTIHGVIIGAITGLPILTYASAALFGITILYPRESKQNRISIWLLRLPVLLLPILLSIPLSNIKGGTDAFLVDILPNKVVKDFIKNTIPDFYFLYNIPGYGHNLGERRLGDPPDLTEKELFTVTYKESVALYLRQQIYHKFTGTGWTNDPEYLKNYEDDFKNDRLSTPIRENEAALTISFHAEMTEMLPHPIGTTSFFSPDRTQNDISYGSIFTGYRLDLPFTPGNTVSYTIDADIHNLKENLTEENRQRYLQVPLGLPPTIIDLAVQLKGDKTDTIEISEAITGYLSGFSYTLEPKPLKKGENFLANFLFSTQKGFCVHFSTAFAILARLSGIPSRYASGFLAVFPEDSDTLVVDGYRAHAWVEIWDSDQGWITVEATVPIADALDARSFREGDPDISEDGAYQLGRIFSARMSSGEEQPLFTLDINILPLLPYIIMIVGFAGSIILAVWGITSFLRKDNQRFQKLVDTLIKKSKGYYIDGPGSRGYIKWGEALIRRFKSREIHIRRCVDLILKVFFGGKQAAKRDIRFLRLLSRELRR